MASQKKKIKSKPAVMPGFDYSTVGRSAILTAPDFNDNMREADIIACAYGEIYAPDLENTIPCISLVARKPEFLKLAFIQYKAWLDATGPDALKVEILYSERGYYISFGPDHQHAIWRTVGIDQFQDLMFYGFTYIKKIDSRQPVLDQIANYLNHPIAPIMLLGAHYKHDVQKGSTPNPSGVVPIPDCPQLLLLNLPVYKTKEEVPHFSALRTLDSGLTQAELKKSKAEYELQTKSPVALAKARERRLASFMPITLHMLRNFCPLRAKVDSLILKGLERWQIEQAIINQRFWSLTKPSLRARLQNPNDLRKAVRSFAELDTPNWDDTGNDHAVILDQAFRDARALLKEAGKKAPATMTDCQTELASLGYLIPIKDIS